MSYFKPLKKEIEKYLNPDQVDQIEKAYLYAETAHGDQKRRTGEPYITHPVAVSCILADMRLDAESIMAALLHDVIEDTGVEKKDIAHLFGAQVADLVDGVSKLTQIKFESHAEAQAENFRKMVLAMARDIRVILIKLADRLHNMRTLGALLPVKRKRIALETLEIYAPIANRLGMHNFRVEFEDLGFAALHPLRYRILADAVKKAHGNRKKIINTIEKALRTSLTRGQLAFSHVWGREKHLYSIYKKMRNKNLPFSQILDVYAFRIIVKDVDNCYRVLGVVHNLYKPVPERFKDYIAIPKANGYQSLHTTLFGPFGVPIEIQIRTEQMDQLAENGIAAHWIYKTGADSFSDAQVRAREWLQGLLEMQKNAGDSIEFIENVKIDLFPQEVYVFTPKGNIFDLPKGATPIDFAYAIHSDIGNTCVASKIDRKLAPLSTVLNNGQTVEIITAPKARPNPAWLSFVVTGKARSSIRHYLKKQREGESIALGKRLLEQALDKPIHKMDRKKIEEVLKHHQFTQLDQLYESIGLGDQIARVVADRIVHGVDHEKLKTFETDQPLAIKGTEGMVITYADCCRPIPGDQIIGMLDKGRGLIIHHELCPKVQHLQHRSDKYISVCWEESVEGEFPADLNVEIANHRGALALLASSIATAEANIDNISVIQRDGRYHQVLLTVSVKGRTHLARVMRRIRALKSVVKITRRKLI
ncbi:MAG: bifunctional GTP diphosphokinase/guanosine-3',5'-bis pyrophosphate 3'-pyrophosphohydrolase [Legionellales bacterium]|nr:bifunctional GTP diphosphokinase/guanosine-3',5'-bis pyrophosphate 3'-pyrophosphohydrolase [Legionellales bacterium]